MDSILCIALERITWKMRLNNIALVDNGVTLPFLKWATLLDYRVRNETKSPILKKGRSENLTVHSTSRSFWRSGYERKWSAFLNNRERQPRKGSKGRSILGPHEVANGREYEQWLPCVAIKHKQRKLWLRRQVPWNLFISKAFHCHSIWPGAGGPHKVSATMFLK